MVMDTISSQIKHFKDAYDEIDKEISEQPECKRLADKLDYFQKQCVNLRRELISHELKLSEQ